MKKEVKFTLKDLIDICKELQNLSSQDDLENLTENTNKYVESIFGKTCDNMQAMIHTIAHAQIQVKIAQMVMELQPKREIDAFTESELRQILHICFGYEWNENEFSQFSAVKNILFHNKNSEVIGSSFMEVELTKDNTFIATMYSKGKCETKNLTHYGLLEYLIEIGFY